MNLSRNHLLEWNIFPPHAFPEAGACWALASSAAQPCNPFRLEYLAENPEWDDLAGEDEHLDPYYEPPTGDFLPDGSADAAYAAEYARRWGGGELTTHFAKPPSGKTRGRQTCQVCGRPIERKGTMPMSDGVVGTWKHVRGGGGDDFLAALDAAEAEVSSERAAAHAASGCEIPSADHGGWCVAPEVSSERAEGHHGIPADFPVRPLDDDEPATDRVTCGTCGLSWDDAVVTDWTPAPGARCPFEVFHADEPEGCTGTLWSSGEDGMETVDHDGPCEVHDIGGCGWTSADECAMAAERAVAGTDLPLPSCPIHDR